jgi:hypothetical protein
MWIIRLASSGSLEMNSLNLLSVVEAAGKPALLIVFTIAVIGIAAVGVLIYHRRHQLFDRDPEVDGDGPAARHSRLEGFILIWSGLILVLVSILYQICFD